MNQDGDTEDVRPPKRQPNPKDPKGKGKKKGSGGTEDDGAA